MKKLLLSVLFSALYVTSASAEFGVNVGVSGNAGIFAATANEKFESGQTNNGSEFGSAGWGSIFVEGQFDKFIVGIDYVPQALETDTTETSKFDKRTANSDTPTASTNKIQIDFEHMTTAYAGFMLGENLYVKAGVTTVEVITNENLGTGSAYGNADIDGTMFGVGYNNTFDSGAFIRVEGNYMAFDGTSKTSTADSEKTITLKNLNGVTGKVSIGKSF
mgnify:CR=1 FL=1